jgi:hypothetical protein
MSGFKITAWMLQAGASDPGEPGAWLAARQWATLGFACLTIACAGAFSLTSASYADPPSKLVTGPPGSSAAIVTNGEFTNLYLWPNPEKESWNEHLLKVAETDPQATTTGLNSLTATLVGTSYFDLLTQYGIEPPTFGGEQATTQECVNQALTNAGENGGVIQWEGLTKFVGCEHTHSAVHSPQVNLFVSPDLKAAEFNPFKGVRPDLCTEAAAYHTKDLEVADFTVVPINTKCNKTIVNVGSSLGHEMVETLSDPGGFGYINETVSPRLAAGNFQQDYNEGELSDVCQTGLHPTGETSFEAAGFGTLRVGPYWSNADATCVPRRIMNETLSNIVGSSKLSDGSTGLIRMTGGVHTLPVPLVAPAGLGKHYLQALELEIKTGSDNLNGGNEPRDGAFVSLNVKTSKKPIVLEHINQGQDWANSSLHAVTLRVPAGISVEELTGLTISTRFNGNDNWDIANVTVKAAVACPTVGRPCSEEAEPPECPLAKEKTGAPPPSNQPKPLIDLLGKKLLADGTLGLVRLTGAVPSFTAKVAVPFAFAQLQVNDMKLTIKTAADNLRAGAAPGENANAVITLTNGAQVTFTDINQRQEWSNESESGEIDLPLSAFPQGTTLNDIKSLTITTNFSGDNWDIKGITLTARVACALGLHPLPKPIEVTSVEANGHSKLSDGSEGLFRFTGGSPEAFPMTVTPPSAANAGKVVTSLELIVTTGGDDIGGGNSPKDNANAAITVNGQRIQFEDINALEKWSNGSTNSVALLTLSGLPPGTKLGEVSGPLEITTNFNGGSEGENWDLAAVKLVASVQ